MLILLFITVTGQSNVHLSLVGKKSSFGGIGYDAFFFDMS